MEFLEEAILENEAYIKSETLTSDLVLTGENRTRN
jgi:hypothetical protein